MVNLAKIAYEGYRNHTGGVSLVSGSPIPAWEDLPAAIQLVWVQIEPWPSAAVVRQSLTTQ
jgi:hypothetical protein